SKIASKKHITRDNDIKNYPKNYSKWGIFAVSLHKEHCCQHLCQHEALHNQHWEQSCGCHSVGDATKHQPFEPCQTTRPQDNGIAGPVYACLTNGLSDIPIGQMCFVGNASGSRASLSQGERVLGPRRGTGEEGTDAARVYT